MGRHFTRAPRSPRFGYRLSSPRYSDGAGRGDAEVSSWSPHLLRGLALGQLRPVGEQQVHVNRHLSWEQSEGRAACALSARFTNFMRNSSSGSSKGGSSSRSSSGHLFSTYQHNELVSSKAKPMKSRHADGLQTLGRKTQGGAAAIGPQA